MPYYPRVQPQPSALERFETRVARGAGCWLWTGGKDAKGYGTFWLNGKTTRAHRFAYEQKYGPVPAGLFLLHSCDNPSCVNPDHLRPGTAAENAAEKVVRGRAARTIGEVNGCARLTWDRVNEARHRWLAGSTISALSRDCGVTTATMSYVVHNKSWSPMAGGDRK